MLILIFLKKIRKSLYYFIDLILIIIDPKVIPRELLGPSNLIKAQVIYIYKLTRVIMVSKNKNLVLTIF